MFFRMDKVSQVAIVVRDARDSVKHYWENLGVGPWDIWQLDRRTMSEMTLRGKTADYAFLVAMTTIAEVAIELVQPLSGESIFREFLDSKGGGLHHLKYKTPDTQAALDEFRKSGGQVLQSARIGEGSFYYLDTVEQLGFVLELSSGKALGVKPPDEKYPISTSH